MRLAVAAFALAMIAASCGSDGWQTKATLSANDAAARIGAMGMDDRRLYVQGVQHILNQHQRIGSFTIGQVVDQERNREQARADVSEHQYDAQRTAALVSIGNKANAAAGVKVWRQVGMNGTHCSLTIDGDFSEAALGQEQRRLGQLSEMMCAEGYAAAPGGRPAGGLEVVMQDLSGKTIFQSRILR